MKTQITFLVFFAASATAVAQSERTNPVLFKELSSGRESRISLQQVLERITVDTEARLQIAQGARIISSGQKGGLALSDAAEGITNLTSEKVIMLGGAGHDIIHPGDDCDYARGGASSDHFVLEAGNVKAGRTKTLRGDEGWDTVVLAKGLSLKDVVKRTSPFQVIDPRTGGRYEIDVEQLGVVDNLRPEDVTEFYSGLSPAQIQALLPRTSYVSSSSKHYSSTETGFAAFDAYYLRNGVSTIRPPGTRGGPAVLPDSVERLARISPVIDEEHEKGPFGTVPVIFSIEGAFLAVGTDEPLGPNFLRNSVKSATISVSGHSYADSQLIVRTITEQDVVMKPDLAEPASAIAILNGLVSAGSIRDYRFTRDRALEIVWEQGQAPMVLRPSLFVVRSGFSFADPRIVVPAEDTAAIFAVVGRNGFAQSFAASKDLSPGEVRRLRGALTAAVQSERVQGLKPEELGGVDPLILAPSMGNKIRLGEQRGPNQFSLIAELEGVALFLSSEAAIDESTREAKVESATISISSLFFGRRTVQLVMSNGDRLFCAASIIDPMEVLPELDRAQAAGRFASFRLTKELVGPLQMTFKGGKTAKLMPVLFGNKWTSKGPTILPIDDGRGRFSFALRSTSGYCQVLVDIGGSTILPVFPKP